jgi:predicted RNase H-like HicB family nuclease
MGGPCRDRRLTKAPPFAAILEWPEIDAGSLRRGSRAVLRILALDFEWYRIPAMKFTIILEPEADGGYSVVCPAVPGCVSQGHDLAAALSNIREAILLCLEVRRTDGLAPVAETPELIAGEIQECLKDRAAEGLPLTIETRQVDVEVGVAA